MIYKPHDYQKYATDYILSHPATCLMLDMGLGKTVITLTALWELILDRFDVSRVLIVAPKRVAEDTWPRELSKWEHLSSLTYSLVLGSKEKREQALEKSAFLYITNRENLCWLVENHKWNFDMVVLDELSSFKSNRAQRFKAMKKVRPLVKRIVGLTGTPAPNSLMDLWAEMYLMDMGQRLGRFITGYRNRYFVPDKRNREIIYSYKPREGAEDAIYRQISDICISMKAADHIKMPERIDNVVEVVMSSKEQKIYDAFKKDMVISITGVYDDTFTSIYGAAIKTLKEIHGIDCICSVPVKPGKPARFDDILEGIAEGCDVKNVGNLFSCIREYPDQKGLTTEEREENIKGAFRFDGDLREHTVALIDDIVSTGSTVKECVRELKRKGAGEVVIVALAINQFGSYWSSNNPQVDCPVCHSKMTLLLNGSGQFFYNCLDCFSNHRPSSTMNFSEGWKKLCDKENEKIDMMIPQRRVAILGDYLEDGTINLERVVKCPYCSFDNVINVEDIGTASTYERSMGTETLYEYDTDGHTR